MLALTVRQPWAWAIIHAGKDVENRTWPTKHRGPLAIHAATKMWQGGRDELHNLVAFDVPPEDELIRGAVIGVVDLVDCVPSFAIAEQSKSMWAIAGQYHWLLSNPRALSRPMPYRGQPGLFGISIPGSYI